MGFINAGADTAGRVFGSRKPKRKCKDATTSSASSRRRRSATVSTSTTHRTTSSRGSTPSTNSSLSSIANPTSNPHKRHRIKPPPPPTPLSRLESLPIELIHRIFLLTGPNPCLASTSLHFTYILSSSHLQSRYLRTNPTDALTRRFTTPTFLSKYSSIPITAAIIPLGMLRPTDVTLLRAVVDRGARCSPELMDAYREAVADGRDVGVLSALVSAGFIGDARCVELAVVEGEREVFTALVQGAEEALADRAVWAAALRQADPFFLEEMLRVAAPPAEMLGEVLGRRGA